MSNTFQYVHQLPILSLMQAERSLKLIESRFQYRVQLEYRIRRCPVPPVSLAKSWSLTISLEKIILKILELEIT